MITLADAQENTDSDVDYAVIDELRKSDWLLDSLPFDDAATPGAGGGTLSYGYTRLVAERGANVRDFNTESAKGYARRERFHVDLVPISGAFDVDRALAHLGPKLTDEVSLQSSQAVKAVRAKFSETLIDGGRQSDGNGFDGLDAALAGSTTEVGTDEVADWSAVESAADAHEAIDQIEEMLSLLDGEPSAILCGREGRLRLRSIGRRAGYYELRRDEFGRQIETYAGIPFANLGARSGSGEQIIPVEGRTVGGAEEPTLGLTDIYAVRLGLDGVHGVSPSGGQLLQTWLPDFTTAGAVKTGEVELGPVSIAVKATRSAAVLRNVRVRG